MVALRSSKSFRTPENCGLCRRYDALLIKLSAGPKLGNERRKAAPLKRAVGEVGAEIVERLFRPGTVRKDYLHAWSGTARCDVAWGQRICNYLKVALLVQTYEIKFVNGLSGTCQKNI